MNGKLISAFSLVFAFGMFFAPTAAAQSLSQGYKLRKIVLDPGHGGDLPGCTYGKFKEKEIVLDVALKVGKLLNEYLPEVEVIYTRKKDVDIGLAERGNVANRAKADLFISIHADAVASSTPRGSSSWVMGLSREESNLQLAMRENSVIAYEEDYQAKYEGFDPNDPVSYIMFSLQQSAYLDQSVSLASLLQKHYGQNTAIPTSRGVRQQIFIVLHRTTMPSVLTEIGFLSNASDRALMTSAAGQEKIARSIFNAISEYKSSVEGKARIVLLENPEEKNPAATKPAAGSTQTADNRSNSASERAVSDTTALEASAAGATGSQTAASNIVFRVQVSASPTRIDPASRSRFGEFAGKLTVKRIGNYYKYFFGETKSYSEALSLQRKVRGKFRDAFVAAFDGDQQVAVTDEMKRN